MDGWKIKIRFSGGVGPLEYVSSDVRLKDPGWSSEIFNKDIESLLFMLPMGKGIRLSGMEQYNFYIEVSQTMSGLGKPRIEAIWVLGKFPKSNIVEKWRVSQGEVVRSRSVWGKEWYGSATRGWKPGRVGIPVFSGLVEL